LEIVKEQALAAAPAQFALLEKQILEAKIEALPFPDAHFDSVLCVAVLHFSEGRQHFEAQLNELWRVLRPGGWLFVRLGTRMGLENEVISDGERWIQPDGSHWYLPDTAELVALEKKLGARRADPLKTSLVVGKRSMGTWSLYKA